MSTRSTASASVSVAVEPLTATGSAAARLTVSPFTVTAKSAAAGTEPVSSPPSKVMVSTAPLTDAEEKTGGLLLVAVCLSKAATSLPDRSCSGLAPALVAL